MQHKYSVVANGNNVTVTEINGCLVINGDSNSQSTLTFSGNNITIEHLPDPNINMAQALISYYFSDPRKTPSSLLSMKFSSSVKTEQKIADFKKCIEEQLHKLNQNPEENSDKIIQYLRDYIWHSNLFEVLSATKELPQDHAVSLFNKDISAHVVSYLTPADINYSTINHNVAISGDTHETKEEEL